MNPRTLNASIARWRSMSAARGDGEPVLAELTLTHPIACESVAPSDRRVLDGHAHGVEVGRILRVSPAALLRQSITPATGDRLEVQVKRPMAETLDVEITALRPLDDHRLEMAVGIRSNGQ